MGRRPEDETDTGPRQMDLAEAVINYLNEHPNAMDSVQGIADWWLSPREYRLDLGMLSRVLQRLTNEGKLEKIDSTEGPLYRRRR